MLEYQAKAKKKYFLFVGMNHPIKNTEFLIEIFKQFKKNRKFSEYKLFLVGDLEQFEDKINGIFSFSDITRTQLRKIYSEATAYLAASYYESFNFPVLEALAQNCQVIGLKAAIIPEFKKFVSLADDTNDFIAYMNDISQKKVKSVNRKERQSR